MIFMIMKDTTPMMTKSAVETMNNPPTIQKEGLGAPRGSPTTAGFTNATIATVDSKDNIRDD
jgi:hypothetical protein